MTTSLGGLLHPVRPGADALRKSSAGLVELVVERVGARGDGIAYHEGKPIFLPFTAPGDRVRARLGMRRGGGREGEVVSIVAAGPGRATPACRHFTICGGCALQQLDSTTYDRVKLEALRTAVGRAGIDPSVIRPMRMPAPARRRARLGIERPPKVDMPVRVGYRERFRHTLVDLKECPVIEPALLALVAPLRELARVLLAPGEKAEASLTRTDSGVDLVFISSKMPGLTELQALGDFAEVHDLARITRECGGREIPVVERRPVRVVFGGVAVAFPPGAFLQASEMAQDMLVEEVLLGVGERRPTLDLFAGLGAFALTLAQGGPVHAVEGDERMSAALRQAGASVMKFTVETRDLERDPLPVEALAGYEAAVFDPPRAGAAAQAAALAHSRVERVVAVSCNAATFARDAALLIAGGFRALSIVPIDQFTWTPHLELVAVFER